MRKYFQSPMGQSSQNIAKTKELMLFLALRLGKRSNYGATLLNKALYFVDNMHYLKTGSPISVFTYIKQEFGSTPEPGLFLSLKDELLASNDMTLAETDFFGRVQKKLMANREPDWSMFTADEVSRIDEVISGIADLTGSEVSELSHQFPAWQAAEDREALPFYTFLLSFKTPSDSDIAWAMNEVENVHGY